MAEGLPPGPQLPPVVQSLAFARDPIGVLRRCRGRHGPIFTLRFARPGPIVVVADPGEALRLMSSDPEASGAGKARRAILPQASPDSVFGADGESHRAARERIRSPFDVDAIARHAGAMAGLANKRVSGWPVGRPFQLLPRVRPLIEEIFVRFVLGVSDPRRAQDLTTAVGRLVWTPGNPPLTPPDRGDGPLGVATHLVFERRLRPVRRLLAEEVDSRRKSEAGGNSILDILARSDASVDEIVAQLVVVLAAAQEPPSIALTWVLDRLGRDPDLAEVFRAQRAGDAGLRAAVIDETLRLRPPALASLRRLTRGANVSGYALAAGTDVMVSIPLVQRDRDTFDEPDAFRPDRFSDQERPAALAPFGGGSRRCPGEELARAEIDAVVPSIVMAFDLRPVSRRPERAVQRATVLVPVRGALTLASRR